MFGHNDRRAFMQGALAASAALAAAPTRAAPSRETARWPIAQLPLPFAMDALAPVISANTLAFHYGKHHKAYVDNVLKAVAGTSLSGAPLEKVVMAAAGDPERQSLFNNAAQAWNHNFYWLSLSPGAQTPSGRLKAAIERDFGSVDGCLRDLSKVAVGQFGSGWGWLVADKGRLAVVATGNADTPILHSQTPLLTVDVWEHAYYLDYQNRRADYVAAVLAKTLNWDFAAANFEAS